MAITPSTSLQSFTINKYTTSESGGTGNSCPSTLYLEVQHKITSTSGNKTYLQVTLILHHAQINLGAGSNDCYISINGEETYWTGPDLYSTTSGKTTTLGTKTIEIEHDSNGTFTNKSFIVRYRFNATYSGVSVKYITNNYTNSTQNTITLPALYSACTAPTSVSASGIIKPTGSFTVSWSGAGGGTNNSITGYRVYYNISSNGTAPTTSTTTYVDVSSTATSGSTTITLSAAATRAYKIVCGVVTKGSAGSSFYSGIKTGGSITINSLPAKPTVSASATVIPSSGSRAITFTITPGADSDSSQTRTVRYAKTGDTQTTAITSGTSITFSAATTVSFWTYDGLEYSEEATTVSITKNTAPTISSFSASVGTFTAFNTSSASSQFRGWADYMTPTITTNKPSGTINRTIEFAKLNSISNFSPDKTINYTSETISSTSSTLSKISPYSGIISAYGAAVDTTYKYIAWRIKYTFNDGIETSAPVYYPTNTNYFYAIPGMSPVNSKNVNDGALFKNISFTLYNETVPSGGSSLTTSVTATIDGQTVPVSKTESTSGNNRTLAVTLTNAPPSNKDVVFTISYVRGGLTKTVKSTVKSRPTPSSFGDLSLSNSTLKPFTSNSDYLFSISWAAFAGCNTLDEVATNYNINSSDIKLLLTKNNTGTSYEVSATPSKVSDVLTLTKVGSSFYPWSNAWGISTYEKSHEYSVQIKATNGYGEVFLSGAKTFNVDFDEPITNLTITKFYRVYSTSSLQALWTSPSTKDSRGFAENNIGCIGLSYSGYTRDTCKVDVYFDGQLKKTFNISNAGKTGNSSYTMVHDSATSTSGDVVINVANEKFTIPEITKATTPVRIVVTNNYSSFEAEISNGMTTVKQTAPTMSLNSLEIDEDKFSGRVAVTDLGITTNNTSSPYRISDGTSVYSSNFALTGSGTNYTFSNINRTGTDFDVKALTLQYTTTVTIYSNSGTGTTTSSKTYYLNYLTVYKASPTVAYRKNSVGINTTSPLADAILDLHQSSTTTNVYFQGTYGEGTSTVSSLWTFDVSNGTIQYTRGSTTYTALDLSSVVRTVNNVAPTNGNITLSIPTIGTGATNAAAGNHTHPTSIATSTATNQVTLGYGGKYSLTAGGNSYIFTMPSLGTNSTTAAAGNHAHGNITNAGDITTTVAIASGDRIVINDESASKINNSSITFGSSTTQYLANNGTWQNVPTIPVTSVNSKTGAVSLTYSDVNAIPSNVVANTEQLKRPAQQVFAADTYLNPTMDSKISCIRANRLAFLPPEQIIIEKTVNSGSTWTDAGVSDADKAALFSENRRATVRVPLINGVRDIKAGLRITITAMRYNVPSGTSETNKYNYWNSNYVSVQERYVALKELYFWVSTANGTLSCKVEAATGAASTTWTTIYETPSNFGLSGWTGGSWVGFSTQERFGGGVTQTTQYWNYRLTFFQRGTNGSTTLPTTYTNQAGGIVEIRGYGDSCWGYSNQYMLNDKWIKGVKTVANVTFTSGKAVVTNIYGLRSGDKVLAQRAIPAGNSGDSYANIAGAISSADETVTLFAGTTWSGTTDVTILWF